MSQLPALPSSDATEASGSSEVLSKGTRREYTIESPEFRTKVKRMVAGFRHLMQVASNVYAQPMGGKVTYPGRTKEEKAIQIGRQQLNQYIASYCTDLETLGKHFTASVGRGARKKRTATASESAPSAKGAQLKSLFYISDPLVRYLTEANYGNGLAMALMGQDVPPEYYTLNGAVPGALDAFLKSTGWTGDQIIGAWQAAEAKLAEKEEREPADVTADMLPNINVKSALALVLERRMATSGILISLFSLIIANNGLQSTSNGQRIHYDPIMQRYFDGDSNTHWVVNREGKLVDITPAECPAGVKDKTAFTEKLQDVNKSCFQRLRERGLVKIKRAGGDHEVPAFIAYDPAQVRNDDWGFLHAMQMVIISYFRVPNELLSAMELGHIKVPSESEIGQRTANMDMLSPDERGILEGKVAGTDEQKMLIGRKARLTLQEMKAMENVEEAAQIQAFIHCLLIAHRERTEPAKKQQREARRREANRIKREQAKTNNGVAARGSRARVGGKAAAAGAAIPPLPSR